MDSIRCPRCEFANWASETVCGRCGSPLGYIESVLSVSGEARPAGGDTHVCTFCGTEFDGYLCTLCRKPKALAKPVAEEIKPTPLSAPLVPKRLKVRAAWVLAALAAVSAAVFLVSGYVGGAAEEKLQAELIQKSFDFRTPVTVSFSERSGELAPGVEVLRELGLVSYRQGMLTLRLTAPNVTVWKEDLTPGERGDRVPNVRPAAFTEVTLTGAGAGASAGWGTFRPPNNADSPWGEARGWRVPVGTREFLGVRSAQSMSKRPVEITEVVFAWRWKPNELGRHFDVSGEEFARLSNSGQLSAISRHFNDSTKTYTGRAMLKLADGQWSVNGVTFEEDGEARTELMR